MDVQEVMAALKSAASESTRATYLRHGAGENTLGVSMANISALQKKIRKDHALACQLWSIGVMEARYLAALVADSAVLSAPELDRWLSSLDSRIVLEVFVRNLASKSPHALSRMTEWIESPESLTQEAGWMLLAVLARENKSLEDATLEAYLNRIEKEIHTSANRTRYVMNGALIAIGIRNQHLREKATAAAMRTGKVEVDHGDTNCKTPDAITYINKSVDRQSKAAKTRVS